MESLLESTEKEPKVFKTEKEALQWYKDNNIDTVAMRFDVEGKEDCWVFSSDIIPVVIKQEIAIGTILEPMNL